jgi:hypothetical protein
MAEASAIRGGARQKMGKLITGKAGQRPEACGENSDFSGKIVS